MTLAGIILAPHMGNMTTKQHILLGAGIGWLSNAITNDTYSCDEKGSRSHHYVCTDEPRALSLALIAYGTMRTHQ